MFDICIYHGNCPDGFTAAWLVHRIWPKIEFVPGVYGNPPPDVAGKHVLMVDFSYTAERLRTMVADGAKSITILDHHKTAQAELADFAPSDVKKMPSPLDLAKRDVPIQAQFDMDNSGAMLTWEYLLPGEVTPPVVIYTQDRDLWRHELKWSMEINAWISSFEFTWENWGKIHQDLQGWDLTRIVGAGEAILRKIDKDLRELLAVTTREMSIGGYTVPVANLPYTMASDGAGMLATDQPFAATYFDRGDGKRVFSLRSTKDVGVDVSEIAKHYDGGGHKHAAGFTTNGPWEGEEV